MVLTRLNLRKADPFNVTFDDYPGFAVTWFSTCREQFDRPASVRRCRPSPQCASWRTARCRLWLVGPRVPRRMSYVRDGDGGPRGIRKRRPDDDGHVLLSCVRPRFDLLPEP